MHDTGRFPTWKKKKEREIYPKGRRGSIAITLGAISKGSSSADAPVTLASLPSSAGRKCSGIARQVALVDVRGDWPKKGTVSGLLGKVLVARRMG
ncbi:hypothetical protein CEXT_18501 [Caerostris extrusa]|uniref:Uncharacterized protein n=1 Tax=Caerostris extrusa TaxID=172846 RepID=A0AAV4RCS1_CAEEX|nr:hypothetical protein CEXT_18501 [Caerostris extrusa]